MRSEELTPWLLRHAYERGIFPMADEGEIEWYSVPRRALVPLSGVHVSRSLAKTIRRGGYEIRFDHDFVGTMRDCVRPEEEGNWIDEPLVQAYAACHLAGWAHSCEVWRGDRRVGGVYGVAVGSAFCAESMFHRETDMSKVALHALVEKLKEIGTTVIDAQWLTPHLASLGAYEVGHRTYAALLTAALTRRTVWDRWEG